MALLSASLFDLAGTASTFGVPSRRNLIESADDPYVAVLRADGGGKHGRRRSCGPFPRKRGLDPAVHNAAKTQAASSVLPVRNKQ